MLFGSIAIVLYLPWLFFYKIMLLAILVSYSARTIHLQKQWQAIEHDSDGWYLLRQGEKISIQLAGDSTITPLVLILRFTLAEKRFKQTYALFKDSLQQDIYRQLIVRLRYFGQNKPGAK